jgi:hypothetical protein
MLIRLMEDHAKEKAELPESYTCGAWHDHSNEGLDAMEFTFYDAPPLVTKGKRKGFLNWRRVDRKTKRIVWLTVAEHKDWLAEYEVKTGNCAMCAGESKIMKRWHHITGMEYQPCPACNGSGKRGDATLAAAVA